MKDNYSGLAGTGFNNLFNYAHKLAMKTAMNEPQIVLTEYWGAMMGAIHTATAFMDKIPPKDWSGYSASCPCNACIEHRQGLAEEKENEEDNEEDNEDDDLNYDIN